MTSVRWNVLVGVFVIGSCATAQPVDQSAPPTDTTPHSNRSTPNPPPAQVDVPWPPGGYVRAVAYSYNWRRYDPRPYNKYIYTPKTGMHSERRNATNLTAPQARKAADLAHLLAGDARVSKCPFPRHGVVFFDAADNPVGSISVCFSCGDIFMWPLPDPKDRLVTRLFGYDPFDDQWEARDAAYQRMTQAEKKAHDARKAVGWEKYELLTDLVLTDFKNLFRELPDMKPDLSWR